jgi:hypothetical protein
VLEADTALSEAPTEAEIGAEIDLAVWTREQYRRQRKKRVRAEIAARDRARRTAAGISRQENRYLRWSDRARAAKRRATNPDALTAMAHRRAVWSSWALRAVVMVGLLWSAVNVGRNLMPEGTHVGSMWWLQWVLGFGVEAMISVPILVIMVQATTAARLGMDVDRTRFVAFESALLLTTVALNAGPSVVGHEYMRAAAYSVVPMIVAFLVWLHAHVAANYGQLISAIPGPDDDGVRDVDDQDEDPMVSALSSSFRTLTSPAGSVSAPGTLARDDHPASGPDRARLIWQVPERADEPGEEQRHLANEMVRQGLSIKSVEEISAILSMAGYRTPNGIADEMTRLTGTKWSRSTVDRILDRAQLLQAQQGTEVVPTAQPA